MVLWKGDAVVTCVGGPWVCVSARRAPPWTRGLHSFTSQLNLSAFVG